jgi:hypothetical protein
MSEKVIMLKKILRNLIIITLVFIFLCLFSCTLKKQSKDTGVSTDTAVVEQSSTSNNIDKPVQDTTELKTDDDDKIVEEIEVSYPFVLKGVKNLEEIMQLTGANSINHTDKYLVSGTDLGSIFEHNNKMYFLFGDTFSAEWNDWRSNVMAYTTDLKPDDGITFDGMIIDTTGKAKELLYSEKVDNKENTVIPTYGISANNNMYIYFMSVKHWGIPGQWECNYSGLARSTDNGQNWVKLEDASWPGDSNLIQVAIHKIDKEIYFWGIPSGRFGGVELMKVAEKDIEDKNKYTYYSGLQNGEPVWSENINDAVMIVEAPVGELSVIWNAYLDRWIMTYLNENKAAVQIREGIKPWGPWGEPITLASGVKYPGLYGPFMNERYTEQEGKIIYFNLSRWGRYNVFWMKAELIKTE